jgi:hypothetical protein
MNWTEKRAKGSAELSGTLFDEVLVPLANARRDAGAAPYFPAWRDEKVATYFERSDVSQMSPVDFEFPGGGTPEGLIGSLMAFWGAEGEAVLARTAPRLGAIAAALREEAAAEDGNVDIFCYTLF